MRSRYQHPGPFTKPVAKEIHCEMAYAKSFSECDQKRKVLDLQYRKTDPVAIEALLRDWDRMVTVYQFPKEHWKHLRSTNIVESPFAALRLRTDAAKRYKKVENATAVIWKMLMLAERRFRRLDAPEKLMQVYLGLGVSEAREGTELKREEVLAVA